MVKNLDELIILDQLKQMEARTARIKSMWHYGHAGYVDFSKKAKRVRKQGIEPFKMSPKNDMEGFDLPQPDMTIFKNKSNKNVYVGGDKKGRKALGDKVKEVMRDSFSQRELGKMNIYFDAHPPTLKNAVGSCTSYDYGTSPKKSMRSVIRIHEGFADESTIVHEMIHARRAAMGDWVEDRDKEETETEFETVMRIKDPTFKTSGYYQYLPGCMADKSKRTLAQIADKKISGKNKPLKGKYLQKNIQEWYNKSNIKNAKIGLSKRGATLASEAVDRYFLIKTKKQEIRTHIRFRKPTTVSKIIKDFKKKFAAKLIIYEYRDGKKVMIYSNLKRK